MKKKLILILLSAVMVFSLIFAVACKPDNPDPQPPVGAHLFEYDPYKGGSPVISDEVVLPTDIPEKAAEPTLQIHYFRNNSKDYKTWGFWLWSTGAEGKVYNLNYQDDVGGVALYTLAELGVGPNDTLGLIPRLQASWTKDCDNDRNVDLSEYTMDANNYYHVYLTQGNPNLYKDIETMNYSVNAEFASTKQIKITTAKPIQHIGIFEEEKVLGETDIEATVSVRFKLPSDVKADANKNYSVKIVFQDGKEVTKEIGTFPLILAEYESDEFDSKYYYDGELGAIYTAEKTTFRVWSPVSTKIVLNIYNTGDQAETPETTEMTKGDKGVFEAQLAGNYGGKYYTYTVFNSTYPKGKEIVDPYAKSAGLNGMRGQIVNFAETNPEGWDDVNYLDYDRKALTVWETHVADVTSSSTWGGTAKNAKKFLGMFESGTTYTSSSGITVKTGFDHIKELGVNAVQLVPIFDQANDEKNVSFNWGYNPLNYNVLEGAYSSDPTDGYVRIREFKQLVQAYNKADITIIMDVVYNHVSGAAGSNFDVLMPGYYFRYNNDTTLSNGSGCGNETASNHSMFRKFMIDSVCFWAKEYKLGGFRFDLMGLHDIETMNQLVEAAKKVNPHITIYGEPWEGGTSTLPASSQADQANGNKFVGYGQFNDQMRDALIKGGLNSPTATGWITENVNVNSSDVNKIVAGLKGVTAGNPAINDPNKTVNYVTCHDNYTLFDRIVASGWNSANTKQMDAIKKMAVLANAVVFTSNGTTFMLAGDEFLRTKGGDSNSYESSYKVNELDYSRKATYLSIFENYKALIAFKQTCSGLHLNENQIASNYTVTTLNGGAAIQIVIKDAENNRTYKIVHANACVNGLNVDFSGHTLYLDTLNSGVELSSATQIAPYQTIIAYVEGVK